MLFSLSSTIPADTQEEFEQSKGVFKSILERQLRDDLGALIKAKQGVELPWAIGPIAVVNEDTRINLIERITNSLRWFCAQLFPASPSQSGLPFQQLLEPIYNPETREVTTAAYLVVHALTRSYLGFTQPRYHDFVSSVLAREDLLTKDIYPAAFANHVATLIEFQNTVRTALLSKEECETGVWTGTEFKLEPEAVMPVLIREILKEWQQDTAISSDTVLLAHLAIALSYENRWTKSAAETASSEQLLKSAGAVHGGASASNPSRLERQLSNAEQCLAGLKDTTTPAEGTLCIFEFASYAVGKGGLEQFAQAALSRLFADYNKEALPPRAWLSFGRFWSNSEAARLQQWLARKENAVNFAVDKYAGLANLRSQPTEQLGTCFGFLDIKPADRFEILFDKQLPEAAIPPSAWDLLAAAFHWFTARRYLGGQVATLPVAAVGSLLKMLEVIYPEHFCCVRINQAHPQLPDVQIKSRVIVLPVDYPQPEDLERLADSAKSDLSKWLNPRLVVARYAAAELLNQRLAFGSGPLKLEFQLNTAEEPSVVAAGWLQAIDWVENRNHHTTLLHYTEQAASPREDTAKDLLREEGLTLPDLADNPWALCVDMGGTGIKGGLYPITRTNSGYQIVGLPRVSFLTEPEKDRGDITGDGRYSSGQQFARRLHDKLVETCEVSIKKWAVTPEEVYKPIAVIGLTWPGAVSGERGREYVSATSKILSRFSGLTDEIGCNSPAQIHALRIRENIADTFRTSEKFGRQDQLHQPPLVTLLNDGEAHTLASLDQFDISDLPPGCTIVLTAGTGTALGVLRDGEPLPILVEAGKLVIDLAAPFIKQGNFPVGTGNKMFSANTFVELAEQIINAYEEDRRRQSLPLEPSAREMLPIQAIELGIYCAELLENQVDVEKCAKEWYGSYAEAQFKNPILPPEGEQDAIEIMIRRRTRLRNALRYYGNPEEKHPIASPNYATLEKVINPIWDEIKAKSRGHDGLFTFVLEVTFRVGCLLADLIATADGLFGVTAALATGGPMSGAMGKLVRASARHELEEGYGYNVVERFAERRDRYRSLRLHGIYFPEPRREMLTSAAWGAGTAVLELYGEKRTKSELLRLEEWLRSRQPGAKVRLDRTWAAQGITHIVSGDAYVDIEAVDVHVYLNQYKAHLGLCLVPGTADEFVKIDNPDIHVM